MRGKVRESIPKEIYDAVLTAQRALVEARGQLLESQSPEHFAQVLACLHRANAQIEQAMEACARACAQSGPTTDGGSHDH